MLVLALLAGVVAALVVLCPRRLERGVAGKHVDAVTLAYQKLLMEQHPEDVELRLRLARAQWLAGELDDAAETLRPISNDKRAKELTFNISLDRWRALPTGDAKRKDEQRELLLALTPEATEALDAEALNHRAMAALELERPAIAAQLYVRMALQSTSAMAIPDAESQCARLTLTSSTAPSGPRCYAVLGLRAALAAGQSVRDVSALSEQVAARFPGDAAILVSAEKLLLSQGKPELVRQWWRQLLAARPGDTDALKHLLELDLATGQLTDALAEAEQLLELSPDDSDRRRQVAQLAEWCHQPQHALERWSELARQGDEAALARATLLATQLQASEALLGLLRQKSLQHALTDAELRLFVQTAVASQSPEEAAAGLREIGPRVGWRAGIDESLAQLLESSGDTAGALQVWEIIATRRGPTLDATMTQARLLWQLNRPDEALRRLLAVQTPDTARPAAYWRLVGSLAWQQENSTVAREAYARLWHLDNLEPGEPDRLVALTREQDPVAALALARQRWRQTGDVHDLNLALDCATRADRWDLVSSIVEEAEARNAVPVNSAMYWRAVGELRVRQQKLGEAYAAYERVRHLEPSPEVQARLVWLAEATADKAVLARTLESGMAQARDESPLWRTYALGLVHAGHYAESLAYYDLEARAHPEDDLWLLSYAEALELAGRRNEASRLRRFVYPRLQARATSSQVGAVIARAALTSDLSGPPAALPWVRLVTAQAKTNAAARPFAVSWLLTQRRTAELADLLASVPEAERTKLPASTRFVIAVAQDDRKALTELANDAGADLAPHERVEALRRTGRESQALETALAAIGNRQSIPEAELLAAQVQDLRPLFGVRADAEWAGETLGPLSMQGWRAGALWRHGPWSVDFKGMWNSLSAPTLRGPLSEFDTGVSATWRHADAVLRFGGGADWRPGDDAVWHGFVDVTGRLTSVVDGHVALRLNDVELGSAALRLSAIRDSLTGGVGIALGGSDRVSVEVSGLKYNDRSGAALATGIQGEVVLDHTLLAHAPQLHLRLTGSAAANALAPHAPDLALGSAATWIPQHFASTGVGIVGTTGDLDDERRRLRLLGEAWVGWMWPFDRLGFRVRAGSGLRLTPNNELVVDGFAASDQPLTSNALTSGLEVRLSHSFRQ